MIGAVPRTTPDTRMADIAGAARSVFMRKGYRRAQVADVAAAADLSPAALYRHVESKEALFHLCFVEDLPGADGYVVTPEPGATRRADHGAAEAGQRVRDVAGGAAAAGRGPRSRAHRRSSPSSTACSSTTAS